MSPAFIQYKKWYDDAGKNKRYGNNSTKSTGVMELNWCQVLAFGWGIILVKILLSKVCSSDIIPSFFFIISVYSTYPYVLDISLLNNL